MIRHQFNPIMIIIIIIFYIFCILVRAEYQMDYLPLFRIISFHQLAMIIKSINDNSTILTNQNKTQPSIQFNRLTPDDNDNETGTSV